MFWKLRHFLFGTHFVLLKSSISMVGIRPVCRAPNGDFYVTYSSLMPHDIILLNDPRGYQITPLTWTDTPKPTLRVVS